MGAPLTRREAREIERSTGRRPVAEASGPVFDTGEIERNSVTSLVSVVPTEVVGRRGVPMVPVSEGVSDVEVPAAFARSVSVRAARPAVLVARQRRRVVAGAAVAASAVALATVAAVVVPGQQGQGAADGVAQADLLSGAQQGSAVPVQPAVASQGPVSVSSDVAAPAQVQGGYEVTVFSSDQLAESIAPAPATTSDSENDDSESADSGDSSASSSGGAQPASGGASGSSGSSYSGSLDGVAGIAESMMGGGQGWLCTDFTKAVYAQMGISLPGGPVSAQAAGGTPTSDPQVGDLVVFSSGHIGIYAGGGMMWDNPGFESSYVGWQNVYRSMDVIGSDYYFVTYR